MAPPQDVSHCVEVQATHPLDRPSRTDSLCRKTALWSDAFVNFVQYGPTSPIMHLLSDSQNNSACGRALLAFWHRFLK